MQLVIYTHTHVLEWCVITHLQNTVLLLSLGRSLHTAQNYNMATLWVFSIVSDFFTMHDVAFESSMWNFLIGKSSVPSGSVFDPEEGTAFSSEIFVSTVRLLSVLQDQCLNYVKFIFKVKMCTVIQSTEKYIDRVIVFIWQLAFVTCHYTCGWSPEWNVKITNEPPCRPGPKT